MSLIFMEGFDYFPDANNQDIEYDMNKFHPVQDLIFDIESRPGRDGGYSIKHNTTDTFDWVWFYPPGGEENGTWYAGFHIYVQGTVNSNSPFFRLQQTGEVSFDDTLRVQFNANNGIDLRDWNGSLLAASTNNIISINTWYHVELKAVSDQSAGEVELKVDGTTVATANTLNTDRNGDGKWSSAILSPIGNLLHNVIFDNLYICNDQGSTNNDFLGECFVRTLAPTSDAGPNDGSPASGNDHYEMVNYRWESGTSNYITLNTDGDKEMFGFESLSDTANNFGLCLASLIKRSTANPIKINQVFKSGASETSLNSVSVPPSNRFGVQHIIETNPDTSNLWTYSEINSGEFGFEIESP